MASGTFSRNVKTPAPLPRRIFPSGAWQPLTPRGVAAFAGSTLSRLCWYQVMVATLSVVAVVWFCHAALFPIFREAIQQLPDEGTLRLGELELPIAQPTVLAEGPWLALSADTDQQALRSKLSPRDLEIRFARKGVLFCTDLGFSFLPYYPFWNRPFNRMELSPWWDAWQPMFALAVIFTTFASLFLIWWVLATIYAPFTRLLMFFSDRTLDLAASWRLSAAALLPGALVMIGNIGALGLNWISPAHFLSISVFHLVVPLVYIGLAPLYLPKRDVTVANASNPFETTPKGAEVPKAAAPAPAPTPTPAAPLAPPSGRAVVPATSTEPSSNAANPFGSPTPAVESAKKTTSSKNPFARG